MSKQNSLLLLKEIIENNSNVRNKLKNKYMADYAHYCHDMEKKYISYLKIPLIFSCFYMIISVLGACYMSFALNENIYWVNKSFFYIMFIAMFLCLVFIISLNYDNYSDFYLNTKEKFNQRTFSIKSVVNGFNLDVQKYRGVMEEKNITYKEIGDILAEQDLKDA